MIASCADWAGGLDLILGPYNRVARMLATPTYYGPVLAEDETSGQILFGERIEGFLDAVRLRPSACGRLTASADQEAVAAFSLLLEMPLIGSETVSLNVDRQAPFLEEAPVLIPRMVLELNRFTTILPPKRPMMT